MKHVYAWGSNAFGQLGIKNKGQSVLTPKQVLSLSDMDLLRVSNLIKIYSI